MDPAAATRLPGHMTTSSTLVLVAATVATGSLAGLYGVFSYAVVPGIARTDDRTFVTALQAINAAILNGWFLLVFAGAPVTAVAATVLAARAGAEGWVWTAAGCALCVSTVVVTGTVNVPLNDELGRVDPRATDEVLAAARQRFVRRWVRANTVRALAATAATACLAWAAVVAGR